MGTKDKCERHSSTGRENCTMKPENYYCTFSFFFFIIIIDIDPNFEEGALCQHGEV